MSRERVLAISIAAAVIAFIVTLAVTLGVRQRSSSPAPATLASAPSAAAGASAARKIKAKLYYVSMDGTKLTGVDRKSCRRGHVRAGAGDRQRAAGPAATGSSRRSIGTKLRAV
jgi:hypothetical protein